MTSRKQRHSVVTCVPSGRRRRDVRQVRGRRAAPRRGLHPRGRPQVAGAAGRPVQDMRARAHRAPSQAARARARGRFRPQVSALPNSSKM